MPSDEQEPEVIRKIKADAFTHSVDIEQLKAQAERPAGHAWVKQGPHIVCHSCPTPHAHFVGHEFDTQHLKMKVSRPGATSASPTSVVPEGDITPAASTEPIQRGRKDKGAK